MKTIRIAALVVFLCFIAFFIWIKIRSLLYEDNGLPLAVRWEGFYHDHNFRDVGASLNECLGEKVFRPGVVLRSAGWFSGWDCDEVGDPDVIYSLNYSPARKERYFCQNEEAKTIGRYFNPDIQLKDLEFLPNWSNPEMKEAACAFFKDIFKSTLDQRKILIHCDAGRDRTGTYAALLAALAAESRNILDQRVVDAIECDYRKTKGMVEKKHGRMERFLLQIQKQGGITGFFEEKCRIPREVSRAFADRMLLQTGRL